MQRRRSAFKLGHWTYGPVCRCGRALPGNGLAEHGGPHRHSVVHLQLFQEAVLGRSERLAVALLADAGGQGHYADAADDGRPGSADSDAADGGILRRVESAGRAGDAIAVRGRVSWDGIEAVEFHPHAALHDELV